MLIEIILGFVCAILALTLVLSRGKKEPVVDSVEGEIIKVWDAIEALDNRYNRLRGQQYNPGTKAVAKKSVKKQAVDEEVEQWKQDPKVREWYANLPHGERAEVDQMLKNSGDYEE